MAGIREERMPNPFQLLLSCPSGLSPSQVSVDFSTSHDRIPHPDPYLEYFIAQVWEQRSQGNSTLFNGQKFRYGSSYCLDGGTNLISLWERFIVSSEDDW